jgi:hypothetical protein
LTLSKSKDNRIGWISSLKEGDEVAYTYGGWGRLSFAIGKITRITPTGRITLSTGKKFDSDGHEMGHKDKWSSRSSLHAIDHQVLEHLEKEKMESKLSRMVISKLTLDQMRKISAILDETAD